MFEHRLMRSDVICLMIHEFELRISKKKMNSKSGHLGSRVTRLRRYIYISTRPHTHKEKKENREKFRQKMTQ